MKLLNGQKHFEVFLKSSFHLFGIHSFSAVLHHSKDFFFFLMSQEGVCELQRGLSFNFVVGVGVAWRIFFFLFHRDVINRGL